MRTRNIRAGAGAVIAAMVALGAVGCAPSQSTPEPSDDQSASEELVHITMGTSRIADLAPLYLGVEQGYFAEEGLDLELQSQSSGSVTVTGVVSGDFQLGFANTVSMLIATTKGLPLQAVGPAASVGTDPVTEDFTAIMVRADSPINTPADLAGTTIAVNSVNSMVDTLVRLALENEGVDSSTVSFLEIGFADQVAALEAGQVDVITPQEPYLTDAQSRDFKTVLSGYYVTAIPNFTNGLYFSTEEYIAQNPEVIAGFQRALAKSIDYANAHEDEVRAVIPSFTGVDAEVAQRIALPQWSQEVAADTTQTLADLLVEFGLVQSPPDVDHVLAPTR